MLRIMEEDGKKYAIIPMSEYEQMQEALEAMKDIASYKTAKAVDEEAFPMSLYDAIDNGENPVRMFREYRNMKTKALAEKAGLSEAFVSQIESGKRGGSTESIKAIAEALNVSIDDLI